MIERDLASIGGVTIPVDQDGNPVGWPPPGAIYCWMTATKAIALEPGEGALIPPPPGQSLDEVRADAVARIQEASESAKCCVMTCVGPGKVMEYEAKRREAYDFVGDASPSESKYPMLAASVSAYHAVGSTEATLSSVAAEVRAAYERCLSHGAAVAAIEQEMCSRVMSATLPNEIAAIEAGIVWPTPEA